MLLLANGHSLSSTRSTSGGINLRVRAGIDDSPRCLRPHQAQDSLAGARRKATVANLFDHDYQCSERSGGCSLGTDTS
jgi:hypothetical protein